MLLLKETAQSSASKNKLKIYQQISAAWHHIIGKKGNTQIFCNQLKNIVGIITVITLIKLWIQLDCRPNSG